TISYIHVLALGAVHGLRFLGSKELMMGGLALSMGLIALTIWALGRPFSGATAISSIDFRRVLDVVSEGRVVSPRRE
ncbi:MAG: hypothetical protein ABIP89_22260, partial [Polyangiaceae bacterium]